MTQKATPLTRDEMLERLDASKAAFDAAMAGKTDKVLSTIPVAGNWTVKDILAHFIAHEQLALNELRAARRGERFDFKWASMDEFNAEAVDSRRAASLSGLRLTWNASCEEVADTIKALTDEDLDPDGPLVTALGTTIDGALAKNTWDHYAEHVPDIERALNGS